jgi:hypothetical protein
MSSQDICPFCGEPSARDIGTLKIFACDTIRQASGSLDQTRACKRIAQLVGELDRLKAAPVVVPALTIDDQQNLRDEAESVGEDMGTGPDKFFTGALYGYNLATSRARAIEAAPVVVPELERGRYFWHDPESCEFNFVDTEDEARKEAQRSVDSAVEEAYGESPTIGEEGICYGIILGRAVDTTDRLDCNISRLTLTHYPLAASRARAIGPVVVPELTKDDLALSCEWTRARGFDGWPELETEETVANLNKVLASRARAIGPGEVVVDRGVLEAIRDNSFNPCNTMTRLGLEESLRACHNVALRCLRAQAKQQGGEA